VPVVVDEEVEVVVHQLQRTVDDVPEDQGRAPSHPSHAHRRVGVNSRVELTRLVIDHVPP
jgi:hypothetical protein